MKVKSEFYSTANESLYNTVTSFGELMDRFKTICGEIFQSINFGETSQEVLQEIYINIYNSVMNDTGEATNLLKMQIENFVSAVDADDCMH